MKKLLILVACLLVPSLCFAGMLEDTEFMGRLWSHTQDQKNAGNANYLRAALGQEAFENKTTGILDSSVYIREESAGLIAEFGSQANVNTLLGKAAAETNYQTRDAFYIAAYGLSLKYAASIIAKQAIIVNFLNKCSQTGAFGAQGIPLGALQFIIGQAQDLGIDAAIAPLDTLKANVFKDDEMMAAMIDDAKEIIGLFSQYKGKARFEAALRSPKESVQYWAIDYLTKYDTAQNQAIANELLLKFFAEKNGVSLILKQRLDGTRMLRSENLNASFEDGSFDRYTGRTLPLGWGVTSAAGAIVTYPAPKEAGAASYDKCIEIDNRNGGTSTVQQIAFVQFVGRQPKALEYGFSYKMAYPAQGLVLIGNNGLSILTDAGESPPQASSITLKLVITYADGTKEIKQLADSAPYHFNWENLSARFDAVKPIRYVQMVVFVSGKAKIYLDDVYVRRQDSEFINSAPKIGILITPAFPIPVQPETTPLSTAGYTYLSAARVTDPDGDAVTGYWFSNLQGDLGEGLSISTRFTKEGEHSLLFTARDAFGLEDIVLAKVTVIRPALVLTSAPQASLLQPINSGSITFTLNVEQLRGYSAQAILYANDRQIGVKGLAPYTYIIDTASLPAGVNKVYAKVNYKSMDGGIAATYTSNELYFYNNNPNAVTRWRMQGRVS